MTKKISRRNMLKGLTTLPLLSAASIVEQGWSSEPNHGSGLQPILYVWLHGLFTIVIHESYIAVLTPEVAEHSYLAGDWKQEKPLTKGEWYRLLGADDPKHPNPAPPMDIAKNAVIPGVKDADMGRSYFLLRLPFPKEIIPIRYVPAQFSGASSAQFPAQFPLVQILKYQVFDRKQLKLEPLDGWPQRNNTSPILNLHIFAEPQGFVAPEHAIAAFDAMVKRLVPGADLKLANGVSNLCPTLDKNLPPGLDVRLQMSLAERNTDVCDKPQSVGVQTGTCFSLFINGE